MLASIKPATGQEIRKLLGACSEDETITEISKIGATEAEIAEARAWLDSDDYMAVELKKRMSPRILEVYEVLWRERDRLAQGE